MKVILQKDVKALGKKGELVEVSEGYAKNYLLKNKLAVVANNENVNIMTGQKKSAEYKKEQEIEHAKKLAKELEALKVVFQAKTGENGKLFGSITAKDIAEKLEKDHKIKLDKKKMDYRKCLTGVAMINSFIIALTVVVVDLIGLKNMIWFPIAIVMIFGLILLGYYLYGKYCEKKWGK